MGEPGRPLARRSGATGCRARRRRFPQLRGVDLDAFLRAVNVVRPSLIRVEADEATYALHVILRFELEVALDRRARSRSPTCPAAWNERMRELLGVEVPDDAHGCLQDIHWAFGELGYFPTYALGNIVSAQLWARGARGAAGRSTTTLAAGDCVALRDWLRENVHRHGRRLDPPSCCARATGQAARPRRRSWTTCARSTARSTTSRPAPDSGDAERPRGRAR